MDRALEEEGHLWPEPLVQLSPSYAPGPSVDELAEEVLPPVRAGLLPRSLIERQVSPHPVGAEPEEDDARAGYLMVAAEEGGLVAGAAARRLVRLKRQTQVHLEEKSPSACVGAPRWIFPQ